MSDSDTMNLRDLGPMVRAKRGTKGLREVASEIGEVSASTLSRIENGGVPDLDTFVRICKWLEVPFERFIIKEGDISFEKDDGSRQDVIAAHLRADRTLDPETADVLVKMIQVAYRAVEQGNLPRIRESK